MERTVEPVLKAHGIHRGEYWVYFDCGRRLRRAIRRCAGGPSRKLLHSFWRRGLHMTVVWTVYERLLGFPGPPVEDRAA